MGGLLALALTPAFWPGGALAQTCEDPFTTDLVTGTGIHVGSVKVCNDQEKLTVTYETVYPWCVKKTNLHVATDLAGIPKTFLDTPKWWAFDYIDQVDCYVPEPRDIFLEDIGDGSVEFGNPVTIAARAVVENTLGDVNCLLGDTCVAWGDGPRFRPRLPATYFTYTVEEAETETSCVLDNEVVPDSDDDGAYIISQICLDGQLRHEADFTDDQHTTEVHLTLVPGQYKVETVGSDDWLGSLTAIGVGVSTSLSIDESQFLSCQEHIRDSCNLPGP